jgi:membrane associated rhomboid family serine protease
MGIYDREYYRKDKTSFLGSIADRGIVCKWLILINGICFVIQLVTIPQRHQGLGPFTEALWLAPQKVLDGEIWRLLTHAFLHDPDSWTHIIFNMLFLWWLGRDVEDIYGSREFLAFYLVAAVLAGLAFLGWDLAQRSNAPALGASGAVTAVMVVCACHFPNRPFLFSFFIPIPLWLLVIINVLQDTFVFVSKTRTGVAVAAHLAGAAFGFLYYKYQWRILNFSPNLRFWTHLRSRPRLRVYHEEKNPRPGAFKPSAVERDEQMEAKVDAVLEKVARFGQSSLTEEEKQILMKASEVYKKRRS